MSELRRIRKQLGLTQELVARRARIGQTTLSNYERGRFHVPEKVAARLARVLGRKVDALFQEAPE
jgi:transcriptional regulator with XRE-family HTH domain